MESGTTRIRRLGIVLASVSLPLLSACGSESTEDASAAYCSSLDALQVEVEELQALILADATVDQLQQQRDAVIDAYDDVVDNRGDVREAVGDDAAEAADAFEDAVGMIPDDAAISEAATEYEAAATEYLVALGAIADEAACGEPPLN